MGIFYDLLSESPLFNPDMMIGYSEQEIHKIARLRDINIEGMLYDYLLDIGRCDSATFAAPDIQLAAYFPPSIRAHIHRHQDFMEQLLETRNEQHVETKPYLIAIEGVADHMYLATESSNPDQILCYDENSGKVYDTGRTLYDYVKYWSFEQPELDKCIQWLLSQPESRRYRMGEMIDFTKEIKSINE